jgi:hypothetical protein
MFMPIRVIEDAPILRNAIKDWYVKWYQVTLDADTENSSINWK